MTEDISAVQMRRPSPLPPSTSHPLARIHPTNLASLSGLSSCLPFSPCEELQSLPVCASSTFPFGTGPHATRPGNKHLENVRLRPAAPHVIVLANAVIQSALLQNRRQADTPTIYTPGYPRQPRKYNDLSLRHFLSYCRDQRQAIYVSNRALTCSNWVDNSARSFLSAIIHSKTCLLIFESRTCVQHRGHYAEVAGDTGNAF